MLLLCSLSWAADLTFVVVGDTQTDGRHDSINFDVFPQIVADMNTHDPDLGLFVGDLVGGSGSLTTTVEQWGDFKTAVAPFTGQVLLVPGNHDVYGGAGTFDAWRQTFDWLPTDDSPAGEEGVSYVWDVGAVRFVAITSDQPVNNPYAISSEGQVWLDRVLDESASFDHTFVMTHHPVSFSDEGGMGTTGGDFWQSLVTHDVRGVFSGHWHRYQPGQLGNGGSTWETIIGTGGGWTGFSPIRPYQQRHGFLLVEVTGDQVLATFYGDEDGDGSYDDVVDQFQMHDTPALGLVAAYGMDDTSDSATAGRSIPLALSGDAALQDGALVFDGDDDWAVAGAVDDYVLSILGDLTLSLWVKPEALQTGEWANALICYATNDYYTEDEETNYAYWLNIEPDGRLRMFWEVEDGNNISAYSTESADWSEWRHVAAVRDVGSRQVRFYVDGVQLGDPAVFTQPPTGANRGMLYLGADTEGSGWSDFQGALDDVCVFDQVLDQDDVGKLAARTDCAQILETPVDTGPTDSDPPQDTEEPTDSDPTTDPPPGTVEPSCGCVSGPASGWFWAGIVGLVALRRRRPDSLRR
jgi:MYXO-CTERM domain-containing protein